MKVIILLTLLPLVLSSLPLQSLNQFSHPSKTVNPGRYVIHGDGMTDGQTDKVIKHIYQARRHHQTDKFESALFIQSKVEESFGGRWNV